ncbi:MAG TPA: tryptophan-rich sensory protein [Clostridiales bacterium]|nr:tryptophan-rich sensory protein [Clostridiales bacterium]
MSRFKIFAKSILIPVIVGGTVGFITSNAINYNDLIQPAFAPPSFLFPIVWTILYVLMGISYGILENKGLVDAEINSIYYLQLTVNAIWSFIFFVFKWRLFAFIWILILDALVIDMIIKFYKKDKTAGLLQIPYLIWILFATVLNYAVYWLNR